MIDRRAALILCVITWLASACFAGSRGQTRGGWTWESVRERLDAEAKDFHSLSADIERTKVTVVVNDRSTETGKIWVRGDKMLLEIKVPSARTILRTGDDLYLYNPGLKRVEEYNLGKNRGLVDQFLLLGFGTKGAELQKSYLVTLLREEKLEDKKVIVLELTPKSDAVRNQISKIQIWLDEATWLPAQQQFFEAGSGDYSIVRYSRVVRNAAIPESTFKPRWPKGTEKVKPRG
ncbi:MAG TPA: outer membrane lipoprotein-sorting protein [Candidatus Polarisedimenticolia bacterium]|nr:outer membrane lipoprotein-sorting protein [Candidatus Polarisedimenticolia bacterium]